MSKDRRGGKFRKIEIENYRVLPDFEVMSVQKISQKSTLADLARGWCFVSFETIPLAKLEKTIPHQPRHW